MLWYQKDLVKGLAEVLFCMQVLESPNDSYPWIQFMAFHVELGELAKARAVAERALQTISFRQACNVLLLRSKMHSSLYMKAYCMAEYSPKLSLPALFLSSGKLTAPFRISLI